MKRCNRCGLDHPHTEFSKNKRYADGLWPYCKPCDRQRVAAWRQANPEKAKETTQRSTAKHRDAINTRKRVRRAANPERTKQERKASYAKYRNRELETMRAWKAAHREQMRAQQRSRYWADPEFYRARQNGYNRLNAGKARAWRMARIARQKRATPAWCDQVAVQVLYDVAARVTMCTGIPHEVDHIVPLRGAIGRRRVVSGLHVEHNLRVVPRTVNRSKSNIQWPHMPARQEIPL